MESMQEMEARWKKEREELTAFLKELGVNYPQCGYHVGEGWKPHVEVALRKVAKIAKEAGLEWNLSQVKQKFCQLRIYYHVETPGVTRENHDSLTNPWIWEENHPLHHVYQEIEAAVSEAEYACDQTCEQCPNPAKPGAASGSKLCEACNAAWKKAYQEKYGEDPDAL